MKTRLVNAKIMALLWAAILALVMAAPSAGWAQQTVAQDPDAFRQQECTRLEADNALADSCALKNALNALDSNLATHNNAVQQALASLNGKTDGLVENSQQTVQSLMLLQTSVDLLQDSVNDVRTLLQTPQGQRPGFTGRQWAG